MRKSLTALSVASFFVFTCSAHADSSTPASADISEQLKTITNMIEGLNGRINSIQKDVDQLKQKEAPAPKEKPSKPQNKVSSSPSGQKTNYKGGWIATIHPASYNYKGFAEQPMMGSMVIPSYPMKNNFHKKKFPNVTDVSYNGEGFLKISKPGLYVFSLNLTAKKKTSYCKFDLEIEGNPLISLGKITIGPDTPLFHTSQIELVEGLYKFRTSKFCPQKVGANWDVKLLAPGGSMPVSISERTLVHLEK